MMTKPDPDREWKMDLLRINDRRSGARSGSFLFYGRGFVFCYDGLADGVWYSMEFFRRFGKKVALTVINTQTDQLDHFFLCFDSLCDQADIFAVAEFDQTLDQRTFYGVFMNVLDE